jgi:hypothetical protein
MGLKDEISSVAFSFANVPSSSVVGTGVWLAFGTRVAHFDISGDDALVLKLADASQTHTLLTGLDGESDVLNDVLDFLHRRASSQNLMPTTQRRSQFHPPILGSHPI